MHGVNQVTLFKTVYDTCITSLKGDVIANGFIMPDSLHVRFIHEPLIYIPKPITNIGWD